MTFQAIAISGSERSGVSKSSGKPYTLFELWFQFDGIPYPFKGVFFGDDIAKCKSALASGKPFSLGLRPDRNCGPEFYLI